jgi:hypothetical protein
MAEMERGDEVLWESRKWCGSLFHGESFAQWKLYLLTSISFAHCGKMIEKCNREERKKRKNFQNNACVF